MEPVLLTEHALWTSPESLNDVMKYVKSLCLATEELIKYKGAPKLVKPDVLSVDENGCAVVPFSMEDTPIVTVEEAEKAEADACVAIISLLEQMSNAGTFIDLLDDKTRSELTKLFDDARDAKFRMIKSFKDLIEALISIQVLDLLDKRIMNDFTNDRVYAYSFAADQERFIQYGRTLRGINYIIEDNGLGNAIMFSSDEIVFARLSPASRKPYVTDKIKIKYSNLVGTLIPKASDKHLKFLAADIETGRIGVITPYTGSISTEAIRLLLDSIVSLVKDLSDDTSIYEYYFAACRNLSRRPVEHDESLIERWETIALLGERALPLENAELTDILINTYTKLKARARIDNDPAREKEYNHRIRVLKGEEEETPEVAENNEKATLESAPETETASSEEAAADNSSVVTSEVFIDSNSEGESNSDGESDDDFATDITVDENGNIIVNQ